MKTMVHWCVIVALVAVTYFVLSGVGMFSIWFWLKVFE